MARIARSTTSKAGNNENVDDNPHKDATPEGHVHNMDEHDIPEEQEDRRSKSQSRHEEPQFEQLDLNAAVKGFLAEHQGDFLKYLGRRDKYKVPSITPYDGLRDPQNFLSQFQYSMINQQLDHVHMCKLFPELLVDNARRWFDSLPPGSIGSYRELMTAFHRMFFQKAESKVTPAHLLTVRQGRGESILDFMTRFNKECLKVADVNDLLIISAFQNGILPGALYKELVKYEPRTATELWRIVDRFAKADEADRKKREADRAEPSDKKKREDDRRDWGQSRRSALDRLQRGPLESRLGPHCDTDGPRRDSDQTQRNPLMKTRTEIYELHIDLFERPRPMREDPNHRSK